MLWLATAAWGQPGKPAPAFENVDVHVSAPGRQTLGGRFRPGVRFEADAFTMMDLISRAYGVPWERIVGGPPWVGTDKFDIIATVPADAPASAALPMIQTVLADRFKLVVHRETRPIPAYAVLAGKHLTLKETTGGESGCKYSRPDQSVAIACTNMSAGQFVQELANDAQEYFDRAVIDKTGLTGRYDFSLHWSPLDARRLRNADGELSGISVQDALDKQLGLTVELRPEPMPVIVVDSVNRTPTPNAPGVDAALNAPSFSEFEVGEIRVHKPETPFKYLDTETETEYFGFTLSTLISIAWNIPPQKREVLGGPDWVKTNKFDLIGKPPKREPWENIQLMLRNLITQRFQLQLHEEDRPTAVYALTVNKRTAKLRDADPTRRSECRETLGNGNVTLTCQNTTMKQLMESRGRHEAWGQIDHPVVDTTGLTGAYDFAVTWVPGPRFKPAPAAPEASQPGGTDASSPTGEFSFFEALEKQLGLKLEQRRLPYPALVIDSAEIPKEK